MKDILRIGEFSKMNNISIRTLRFYDHIDLLKPYKTDPITNYRLYHIEQSSIVDSIQYLRQLNFSLDNIKQILSGKKNVPVHTLIEEKYQYLLAQKEHIEQQIHEIEIFKFGAYLYQEKSGKKEIEIVSLPKRQFYSFNIDADIYRMNHEEYEYYLRIFKQEVLHYNPFFNHFGRVGSLMTQKNFVEKNFFSNDFLIFSEQTIKHKDMRKHILPQGTYAVGYCCSFDDEIQTLPCFLLSIKEKGLNITGDYICEVIYEQPSRYLPKRDMFIRIQIAVDK